MDIIYCPWEPATFLFISENVPLLINYSHFIAIFAALSVSLLVFFNNPQSTISRLFLLFSSLFTIWALLNVMLWATNDPGVVRFAWSLQVLIEPITYALATYLFYLFTTGTFPRFRVNLVVFALLFPLVLFLPTTLNLEALYLSSCEFDEGPLAEYYTYFLNLLFILAIIIIGFRKIPLMHTGRRATGVYFGIGLVTFLFSFTSGNILSSFTDDWTISQYGLFGMPIFALLIAYSIVRFKAFKIQIAGAQILVVVLWAFVASLLFVDAELAKLIAAITLVFTLLTGYMLIVSVRHEAQQKAELEKLTGELELANERLMELDKLKSEFVSIASHQLRSPITTIRGYASMLLDGSFGNIPQKAKEPLERIEKSSQLMASSIEDYLNVSRIESGNMKYNPVDFNLKDEVEHVCDDMRATAVKKGLGLIFRTDIRSKAIIHADLGKTVQIVQNLITNSIKYTPEGTIKVLVRDDIVKKKVYVDIVDTGIGMSQKTISKLFGKFERADNAHTVNATGTGLGLFVAYRMTQAMGGDITAHSEGDGKGSRFTLEMPLAM